jgi:predicted ATPase
VNKREQRYVTTGAPGSGKTPVLRELASRGLARSGRAGAGGAAEQRAVGGDGVYEKDPRLFWALMLSKDDERRMTAVGAASFGALIRRIYLEQGYTLVDVPRDTIAIRADFIVDTIQSEPAGP